MLFEKVKEVGAFIWPPTDNLSTCFCATTGEQVGCCYWGAIEIREPNATCSWCFKN
jgi:hypothetical protein